MNFYLIYLIILNDNDRMKESKSAIIYKIVLYKADSLFPLNQ